MTKKEVKQSFIVRVSPKGQIVLRKEIREKLGIKQGSLLRQEVVGKEIRLVPIKEGELLKEVEKLAKRISKRVSKSVSSVELVKGERRW